MSKSNTKAKSPTLLLRYAGEKEPEINRVTQVAAWFHDCIPVGFCLVVKGVYPT